MAFPPGALRVLNLWTTARLVGLVALTLSCASCGTPTTTTSPTPVPEPSTSTAPTPPAPAPSGPTTLTITIDVYNATTGFITSLRRPANHGDRITLVLSELGMTGIDTRFASLRELPRADNTIGRHIANSTTGTLSFAADQSRTNVSLWLFNATNGSEYYHLYFQEEFGYGYVQTGVGQALLGSRREWASTILGAGVESLGETTTACPMGLWSGLADNGTAGAIEQMNLAWNPFGVVYARITDAGGNRSTADLVNGCFSARVGPLTQEGSTQSIINVFWYSLSSWRFSAMGHLARSIAGVGLVPSLLRPQAIEHGMLLGQGRDDLIFLALMPPI